MGSRKRRSRRRTNWVILLLLLGIGGGSLVLLLGLGAAIVWLLVRSGDQQAQQPPQQPSATAPAHGEYDEWAAYEAPFPPPNRTAWVRIKKVLILDKAYRKLDRLQQELPPGWRANSPAEADAIVLIGWRDHVTGMGNAVGDGKVITYTPFDLERAGTVVISPRKEYYGQAWLSGDQNVPTVTAAKVVSFMEELNSAIGGPNDPAKKK
jgi:hypothetical protein